MMRGQDHWAVAVREPDGDVYVESHDIDSIAARHAIWRKPFFRGDGRARPVAGDRRPRAASSPRTTPPRRRSRCRLGRSACRSRSRWSPSSRSSCSVRPAVRVARESARHPRRHRSTSPRACSASAMFVGYLLADRAHEGHPPRVRVPRRRAQDDRRLRARRRARARADRQLSEGARALRHELLDHRDDRHGLRVLVVRHARIWCGGCSPESSRSRSSPGFAYEALRLGARYPDSLFMRALMRPGDLVAEDHDAGARYGPDRGRGRLVRGGASS